MIQNPYGAVKQLMETMVIKDMGRYGGMTESRLTWAVVASDAAGRTDPRGSAETNRTNGTNTRPIEKKDRNTSLRRTLF